MKSLIWLSSSCALHLLLTGCGNQQVSNDPLGTGPFDRNGEYREEWANDPSKWRKPSNRNPLPSPADDLPVVTANEQPPANANPLVPQIAANTNTKATSNRTQSAPRETTRLTETKKTADVASKPKPKPKPVVVKAKPKPKVTRYLVKSGDSLSKIASRNGTSVSAIQRANGISGTLIRPGQSLVIPKR